MRLAVGYFGLLVCLLVVGLFFLKGAKADVSGLLVQNTEITPAVAEIGEHVSIKIMIRNIQRNDTFCNVTLFCGDCVVGTKKINIPHQSSVPVCFTLKTGSMSAGVFSIELLVEEPSGQQKTFYLGSIPMEEAGATAPDVVEPEPNEASDLEASGSSYFNWQFLIPIAPVGATATVLVLRKQRNKKQDSVAVEEQLPQMFNEILKFEGEIESGISDENKRYIC